jgi:hypothetical protein
MLQDKVCSKNTCTKDNVKEGIQEAGIQFHQQNPDIQRAMHTLHVTHFCEWNKTIFITLFKY